MIGRYTSFMTRVVKRKKQSTPKPPPLPDHVQAIYQKAANGHLLEQVLWGKILLNSVFIPPDPSQAYIWFSIAAQTNYGPAHNMLGRCHHFGWGTDKDLSKAAHHYAAAAAVGDEWGRYNLAIMHMRGLGMPRDLPTAFQLFQTGAHHGHAKSMNIMARFYEEGWVVKKNQASAFDWYRRSAESGDYRGCHNHATILVEQGQLEQALHWWQKALPDATSDILLAMNRTLASYDHPVARSVLKATQERLQTLLHKPEQTSEHSDFGLSA
ncbi:tetratricopeptide repeat protein [Acetobacter okinawensis]|uniref:tetratricopeptide repeat protein n=1 Tax=Acetobacter okinawensis TaxID=1076594 RepID=UPI001FD460B2|nr:tetratricopeptide repeat protein [Acetobacter okinawensis]